MKTPTDITPFELTIAPREKSLMGLPIRRILPWRRLRHCGPFVFLDHMGPHTLADGEGLDVPPHPHIGLSTLTWLFEGALEHRDSLGSMQLIRPGEVNWMTAGRGIVHSERSPATERSGASGIEGLQFWVAQPTASEAGEPRFEHYPAADLPAWQDQGSDWVLVAGDWRQRRSPVRTDSPLTLLDVRARQSGQLALPRPSESWEWGLYLLDGSVHWQGRALEQRHLGVTNQPVELNWAADSHFILLGGEPLGERLMDWNFVASEQALLDRARHDWQQHAFEPVPGDDGYVPYPG